MTNQGGAGEGSDPIALFQKWYGEARENESGDASAVALATVDAGGSPSVRMVLLKEAGPRGFVFFTNLDSRKGLALKADPRAAMCFYWDKSGYQVRVEGRVEPMSAEGGGGYGTRLGVLRGPRGGGRCPVCGGALRFRILGG